MLFWCQWSQSSAQNNVLLRFDANIKAKFEPQIEVIIIRVFADEIVVSKIVNKIFNKIDSQKSYTRWNIFENLLCFYFLYQ